MSKALGKYHHLIKSRNAHFRLSCSELITHMATENLPGIQHTNKWLSAMPPSHKRACHPGQGAHFPAGGIKPIPWETDPVWVRDKRWGTWSVRRREAPLEAVQRTDRPREGEGEHTLPLPVRWVPRPSRIPAVQMLPQQWLTDGVPQNATFRRCGKSVITK